MTDSNATEITLSDVLSAIVGQHHPQGDTAMDEKSACNMAKLETISKWVAHELSLDGRLDSYLNSQFYSMKSVAKMHDELIIEMLEWFEPQVKRYYETWMAGDDDDR